MRATLTPSPWTVAEARAQAALLQRVTTTADEYDVVEHFIALCSYLDDLSGERGFDDLLPALQREALAARIERVRTGAAAAEGVPADSPDLVDDRVVQFDQPVNSALTLAEGRRGAAFLAAGDGWQRQVGLALQGLYAYLDELHGGPGAFVELLTAEQRELVAVSDS